MKGVRLLARFAAMLLSPALAPAVSAAPPAPEPVALPSGPCDRACLTDVLDAYLAAMVAHDPGRLLWASDARYTENTSQLRPGEGLWATASGLGHYRAVFADTAGASIAFHGVMLENGEPVMLGLRLKLVGRRIAEAEHLVVRNADIARAYEARGAPPKLLDETVPPDRRVSREALIAAADAYFDGIEQVSARAIPFGEDCNRFENGRPTTNVTDIRKAPYAGPGADIWRRHFELGCAAGIDSGMFAFITEARARRYVVADEERGIVVAFVVFAHPGNIASVQVAGHEPIRFPPVAMRPFDTFLLEAFKVDGGRIRQIEAVIGSYPLAMKTGWDN